MKKGLRTIPFFVIATVAMAFAFATCSVDDLLADASENGSCATGTAEHTWNTGKITIPATEDNDGETLFTCTTCGKTKTEAIPALGHKHTIASKWTSDEAYHWHEASCEKETHRTDKAAHKWDKGETTTAATETDDGETLFTCTTCGTTKTEAIPALGHEHIIASEWTADEQFHWHDASCGREEHRTGKTAHTWDNGTITKPATEQETGEKAFTCTVCGRIKTEVIPTLKHEHTMASEWTTDEQFHWREASCGREEHRTYKIAHTWYPEITKAATCTAEGERTYTCTVCNITRTESIAMTEHSYSTTWKGDASGHWNECIGCGKQENFAEHATMIVTLTSDGERKEICPTCGYGAEPSAWTKETLSELYNALENYAKTNTNAKVKVVGEFSEFYFSNILYNFSSKYGSSKQVDIDLSGITGLTKINDMYFRSYTSLASIILPNGITTIGKEAFKGCTSLTSVTLPNDLTTIGDYAFSGCTSLASATLPNGLTTIGKYAFNECTSLASATLPNGLTTILDYTFSGCTSLASITIPDSVTTIWTAAFNKCTSLTNVTLPANITEIRTAVFSGCTNLASITIPKSVTKIGASAFSSCEQLEKVENMEGVTIIDEYAFQSCKSLKTIRFPPSVTEIGRFAFHLSGLETIEFSEGLKKIKSHAFASCRNLMGDIEIPSSVIILDGASAFSDCTSLSRIIFKDTSGWLSCGREVDLSNPVSNAFRLVNSYPASSLIGSDLYKE